MSATAVLIHLLGEIALLLWGINMVNSGVQRAFGSDLRWILGVGLKTRLRAFLAGLGVFDGPERFATHRDFGYTISLLILVMIVLSLVGRGPARLIGLSVLLMVQIILQSVFIVLRTDSPQIAALHPVNGVLMLIVSLVIAREAWAVRRAAPAEPAASASEPTG